MGRFVDVDLLVLARHIVERLPRLRNVQAIHYLLKSDDTFPKPVLVTNGGIRGGALVFYWPDVEQWAQTKGWLPAPDGDQDASTAMQPSV